MHGYTASICDESFCSDWIKRESKARELKRGILKALEVIPPWEWRKDRDFLSLKIYWAIIELWK
jgi:hypothetical protein